MNTNRPLAIAGAVVLITALVTLFAQPYPSSSSASTNGSIVSISGNSVLYLDIGASVSVGVQPTTSVPHGQPTNRGYSNRLVSIEAAKGVSLKLTELGCPGESIASMLHGPDPCYAAPDTQLSDAIAFLHAHHNAATLVTVDLGFNTLDVCLHHLDIDFACVAPQLTLLRRQLGQVMRALTSAAGPNVSFVGVGHYNPYLVLSTKEGSAEVFATHSVTALGQLNRSLTTVYGSFNVPMADIATAFHVGDSRVVRNSKKEATTVSVQYECKLTWMCAPKPYGPNIHPNNAGYWTIAKAIALVIPPKL